MCCRRKFSATVQPSPGYAARIFLALIFWIFFGQNLFAESTKVEVFVTSWCPYCRALEAFLKEQDITYTRYDIEKSSYGRRRYQELGAGGVPVMLIGSEVIRGFNRDAIYEALEKLRKRERASTVMRMNPGKLAAHG